MINQPYYGINKKMPSNLKIFMHCLAFGLLLFAMLATAVLMLNIFDNATNTEMKTVTK